MASRSRIKLNAPAGSPPCLMAAVDAGADSVYIGFRSPTNLRNLPGLNFSVAQAAEGVAYAHQRGAMVHVAVNTHPLDHQLQECYRAVDAADEIGEELASLSGEFKTASDVNHVLGKLFTLLAQNRISRRDAVSLAYIAQLMLHSLPSVRREIKDGLGHASWQETLSTVFSGGSGAADN